MINLNDKIPYMIAEIGINHQGDIKVAKKLIDAAFACNWDCVKFQKRNPDKCVPEHQRGVLKQTPWGEMTYLEYKKKIEFNKRDYNYIDKYCKDKPIDWSASVWDVDSLEFILQYDVPFIKIPSALLIDSELLKQVAQSRKTVFLSTGMSTVEEIDVAFNILLKYNNDIDVVLLHCNSSYPAEHSELNLRVISFLKNRYRCQVGYSGHEMDLEPSVLAAALGAVVIERHVTLDHNMWGTDQKASLEVHAMDMLRKRIKEVHTMLGDGIKKVTESEKEILKKLRKL
jgi:N-acetylneuraminate synthase